MERTPLVAMKSKLGELGALLHLERTEASRVRLYVELVAELKADAGYLLRKLAKAVLHLHRFDQTILLDATKLHASSRLWQEPGGPLDFISDYLTRELENEFGFYAGVPFVPVISITATDQRLRDVARVREGHDCILGLRVDPARLPAAEAMARVQHCLDVAKVESTAVALVIDAGFVTEKVVVQAADCLRTIAELKIRFSFESITVLSGSIPTSAGRAKLIPDSYGRPELELWQAVADQEPTVRYGDYGVVNPVAPEPQPKNKPMNVPNPYMYYTGRRCSRFAINKMPRGKNSRPLPGEKPDEYFREVAQELIDSDEYKSDATGAWGDRRLLSCSRGNSTASKSHQWIEIGTSHHIAHLAADGDADLANRD